jgi:putative transposase
MARKLRVEYPGAIYHVMNRGDRREDIFKDDKDRENFLERLAEVCLKTGWQVHAYCLMGNHFHLVVETPQGNLVAGMKWFLGTYTGRFNRRHKVFGHLFSGRYKALVVDGSGNGYLRTVCEYVHLNPVRAKLVKAKAPLEGYGWSSYGAYLSAPGKRPKWLRVDRVLGEAGVPKDSVAGRREYGRMMEERRGEPEREAYRAVRRGWCLGDEAFRKELLGRMSERVGPGHYGEEVRASGEAKAERIVVEELRRLQWTAKDLRERKKGDVEKVRIAARLRTETTMTIKWIAERMQMGAETYARDELKRLRLGKVRN